MWLARYGNEPLQTVFDALQKTWNVPIDSCKLFTDDGRVYVGSDEIHRACTVTIANIHNGECVKWVSVHQ